MKFSKLLTTAMMSVALVASSSAFAAEETTWWSMNFDGLTIEEGGSLTNTLNTAYGITQKGAWSTEEGDLSSLAEGKLVLNTQGTDLTWTPNGDNDPDEITYIDATVKFVGSDSAPTISETDVHTAVYLKNIINEETGEVDSSVLCAWARLNVDTWEWIELDGVTVTDEQEYRLRIMLEENTLSFYLNETLLKQKDGVATKFLSAKDSNPGAVDSVSFRGTGSVDFFAASQEVKVSAGTAYVDVSALWNDEEIDSDAYLWLDMSDSSISLDSTEAVQTALVTIGVFDISAEEFAENGSLGAIGVTINDGTERLIQYNDGWPTDSLLSFELVDDVYYSVKVEPSQLTDGDNVEVVFYYGTHTATEPDPEPDPEVPAVEPDAITIAAITGPVDGNVVVTVVPAEDGGKIKAGVNYWAITAATLGGAETALEPVTVDADTDSLQITVPATGDSLFIKVKAATATAE